MKTFNYFEMNSNWKFKNSSRPESPVVICCKKRKAFVRRQIRWRRKWRRWSSSGKRSSSPSGIENRNWRPWTGTWIDFRRSRASAGTRLTSRWTRYESRRRFTGKLRQWWLEFRKSSASGSPNSRVFRRTNWGTFQEDVKKPFQNMITELVGN